ncbi:hypothetical protein A2U01_0083942, partial [Trifolium medium]|nr:hypothetical protein [Trifolium medium]
THEEFEEMLHELALPSKDWQYNTAGDRTRLNSPDMEPIAKAWAFWLVANLESR